MGQFLEIDMLKKYLLRLIHNYQSAFNEQKYWKRRLYIQKRGG